MENDVSRKCCAFLYEKGKKVILLTFSPCLERVKSGAIITAYRTSETYPQSRIDKLPSLSTRLHNGLSLTEMRAIKCKNRSGVSQPIVRSRSLPGERACRLKRRGAEQWPRVRLELPREKAVIVPVSGPVYGGTRAPFGGCYLLCPDLFSLYLFANPRLIWFPFFVIMLISPVDTLWSRLIGSIPLLNVETCFPWRLSIYFSAYICLVLSKFFFSHFRYTIAILTSPTVRNRNLSPIVFLSAFASSILIEFAACRNLNSTSFLVTCKGTVSQCIA